MPRLTALLHTHNDGLRLGRCLETVYPCDEILIVDHGSQDRTLQVAREYGARVLDVVAGMSPGEYLRRANADWVLCLDARESLTESLAASLFEWKRESLAPRSSAFSVLLREETAGGWIEHLAAQIRVVSAEWDRWQGHFPAEGSSAVVLEGELLRFVHP